MLPVQQPSSPVLLGAAQQHRATGTASVPSVPLEEDRSWRHRRQEFRKQACREAGGMTPAPAVDEPPRYAAFCPYATGPPKPAAGPTV